MCVTAVFCVTFSDSTAFLVQLVGIVPQNFICIVLPCATYLQLAGDRLNGIQRCALKLGIGVFTLYSLYAAASLIKAKAWSSGLA